MLRGDMRGGEGKIILGKNKMASEKWTVFDPSEGFLHPFIVQANISEIKQLSLRWGVELRLSIAGPEVVVPQFPADRSYIWKLLAKIIKDGYGVIVLTRIPVTIAAGQHRTIVNCSEGWLEEQLLEQLETGSKGCQRTSSLAPCIDRMVHRYRDYLFNESCWSTERGRAFVVHLREQGSMEECMVCLHAFADTIVTPCHHRVICRKCLHECRSTRSCDQCIKCRGPVTSYQAI